MKKLLALLLALCLTLPVFAFAEEESLPFEPKLTNLLTTEAEADVDTWYTLSKDRAYLTVFLWLDFNSVGDLNTISVTGDTYVIKTDEPVLVAAYPVKDTGEVLMLLYDVSTQAATYRYMDKRDINDYIPFLCEGCDWTYEKNNISDILVVLKEVLSLLES